MGLIDCPETSGTSYQFTLRENPEERRPQYVVAEAWNLASLSAFSQGAQQGFASVSAPLKQATDCDTCVINSDATVMTEIRDNKCICLWRTARHFSRSGYIASKCRMISDWWIGRDVEGNCRGLTSGSIPTFAWNDCGKPSYMTVGAPTAIGTGHRPENTSDLKTSSLHQYLFYKSTFFYVWVSVHHKYTVYYIKYQQDATLAVLFISHCKITLHVSDAFCVHHQEY